MTTDGSRDPAGFPVLEKERGSLEPGKIADMVILSGNPYTVPKDRIKDLRVEQTILSGKPCLIEKAFMLNATEIYAGAYKGGSWNVTRLTENSNADMAPVVASSGNRASGRNCANASGRNHASRYGERFLYAARQLCSGSAA